MSVVLLVPPAQGESGSGDSCGEGATTQGATNEGATNDDGTSGCLGDDRREAPEIAARDVLASGARVYVVRDPSADRVALRAAWPGGLRREGPELGGIHHLLARVITSGCGERGEREVRRRQQRLGGSIEGFASRDGFGLRGAWPADDWRRGFDVFADCAVQPRFEHSAILRERERMQERLRARKGDPSALAFRGLARALYGAHPYGQDPLGEPESIDRLSPRVLRAHFRDHYPQAGMTLAIVGDVEPAEALDAARARFGAAPDRDPPSPLPAPGTMAERDRDLELYEFIDGDRAFVVLGFRGAALGDPDRYALEVLASILGAPGGRLARALGELDTVYDFGAVSTSPVDPGYLALYAATSPEERSDAARQIERAVRRVSQDGARAAEVDRAIASLADSHRRSRHAPAATAAAIALHEAYGLGYAHSVGYADRLEAVTVADVDRVAQAYMGEAPGVSVTATPMELSPGAERRVRAGGQPGEGADE